MTYTHNILQLKEQLNACILGQEKLINMVLIGIFAQGHILLESVPGLAKTTLAKTLAKSLQLNFKRIQFTPDLLPSDILGAQVYNPKKNDLQTRFGPIFTNILLADEINRAPAKVQSALLEAMQERQVTIGEDSYLLQNPFIVIATSNPIESEGVYALPEAQLDRFMLTIPLSYPDSASEVQILQNKHHNKEILPILDAYELESIKQAIQAMYCDESLYAYIVALSNATRQNILIENVQALRLGVSPRASLDLSLAAKTYAFLHDKDYVSPSDVLEVLPFVFAHRILPSFEALAMGIDSQKILDSIIACVPIP